MLTTTRNSKMKYLLLTVCLIQFSLFAQQGIYIDPDLPYYWSYNGEPLMLIGGSSEDNLFQTPNVAEELELISSVGGNYVRCTMSSRDSGNVWAFQQVGNQYNLRQFNDEYWNRFSTFLDEAEKRDIVVQIELWATFDFYRDNWNNNPFNPKRDNNAQNWRVRLPDTIPTHPIGRENPFFWSVPKMDNNTYLLTKQVRFVDKLLSISFQHNNVLYCIDNETSVTAEWALFWANYIKTQATLIDKEVYVTEMWDPHDLMHPDHFVTIQHPELFDFIDISQNNHQENQQHYDNGRKFANIVYKLRGPCPLNNVKVYGKERHGSSQDGLERFWRSAFLGAASVRFHRPNSGHGISDTAQYHIQALRSIFDNLDLSKVHPSNQLLDHREDDEAYCLAISGETYAVYFPQGGSVVVKDEEMAGNYEIKWLNINEADWKIPTILQLAGSYLLETPDNGHWACLIQKH